MWEHTHDVNGGQVGAECGVYDYKFKVTVAFSKCLKRQVDDGVRIRLREQLFDKCEYLNFEFQLISKSTQPSISYKDILGPSLTDIQICPCDDK